MTIPVTLNDNSISRNVTVGPGDSSNLQVTGLATYTSNVLESETFEFGNNMDTNEISMKFAEYQTPSTDEKFLGSH